MPAHATKPPTAHVKGKSASRNGQSSGRPPTQIRGRAAPALIFGDLWSSTPRRRPQTPKSSPTSCSSTANSPPEIGKILRFDQSRERAQTGGNRLGRRIRRRRRLRGRRAGV